MGIVVMKVIFITGVSGSGKSTVGKLLSQELRIPFFDGDDYHPQENIDKMSRAQSLNDDDRYRWLIELNKLAKQQLKKGTCIIACSALKENYRKILSDDIETETEWVFLSGTYDQILKRMQNRKGHFMPDTLLRSQFETLEEPEYGIKINIKRSPKEIVNKIKAEYGS